MWSLINPLPGISSKEKSSLFSRASFFSLTESHKFPPWSSLRGHRKKNFVSFPLLLSFLFPPSSDIPLCKNCPFQFEFNFWSLSPPFLSRYFSNSNYSIWNLGPDFFLFFSLPLQLLHSSPPPHHHHQPHPCCVRERFSVQPAKKNYSPLYIAPPEYPVPCWFFPKRHREPGTFWFWGLHHLSSRKSATLQRKRKMMETESQESSNPSPVPSAQALTVRLLMLGKVGWSFFSCFTFMIFENHSQWDK